MNHRPLILVSALALACAQAQAETPATPAAALTLTKVDIDFDKSRETCKTDDHPIRTIITYKVEGAKIDPETLLIATVNADNEIDFRKIGDGVFQIDETGKILQHRYCSHPEWSGTGIVRLLDLSTGQSSQTLIFGIGAVEKNPDAAK